MKKQIKTVNGAQPLTVKYITCEKSEEDTEIEIYDTNKITVLLSDGLVAVLDDKLIGGQNGDVLLFNPNEVHFGRFLRVGEYKFLEIYFPKDFWNVFDTQTQKVSAIFETNQNRVNCIRPEPREAVEVIGLAQKIAQKLTNEESDFEVFCLILQLVNIAANLYPKAQQTKDISQIVPQVQKAVEYISSNFTKKISLWDIAQNSGCSVAYLSKQFKRYVGVTAYEFLTIKRLEHSASLLSAGSTVWEAGRLSGFDDCSNYIRKFKKEYKITPYKYKNAKEL